MPGSQTAWGIDVGASSLKAIKLRRDGDRVNIESFEVIEHEQFLSEPDANRDALIRATLQKFMDKNAVRRDVVYISVPGSMTFARFVKLPPIETKKIPEIVRFEAIQQIPFPLDQVNWDYHTFQHPDSPDVEVGIFAMKKELVAGVMSNFRAVDMNVQGVQMSSLAVYNAAAFDGMTDDKGTIVIDMGAEHTDLVIMDQGRMWLRTINIGGNHFTDALAKSFKQPFARAETLKKTAATSKYQKQIYQAMRPIFADLVAEIQRSLGAYNSTHRDSRLERIVGMGNPFKLPNLQKYLQQELKMDVVRLENFRMANVEKAAAFSENILSMTAAYGLAVQALGLAPINSNLLPTEIARAMMWRKKQPWFIAAAALLVLGAVGIAAETQMAKADFASPANEAARNENMGRQAAAATLVDKWNQTTDTYNQEEQQVNDQLALLARRKVWPMLYTDIMSSFPPAGRQGIVMIDLESEYQPHLSSVTTDVPLAGTSTTPGGAAPAAPMLPPGTPSPTPTPDTTASGGSDHGFIVQITGYIPGGSGTIVNAFVRTLQQHAPDPKNNKPYYFSQFYYGNKTITGGTSAATFSGGGFGTPTGSQATERPWGGANKGPYFSIFVPDLTGIHPEAAIPGTPGGMGPGGVGLGAQPQDLTLQEIPPQYTPIDLYTTRLSPTPKPVSMNGAYWFQLRFKAHVKEDIK